MYLGLRKKLKKYFAVCEAKNARQRYLFAVRFVRTHGKGPFFSSGGFVMQGKNEKYFAVREGKRMAKIFVCSVFCSDARQRSIFSSGGFVMQGKNEKNTLPCAREKTHGKHRNARQRPVFP
jgi:hypothetical protein